MSGLLASRAVHRRRLSSWPAGAGAALAQLRAWQPPYNRPMRTLDSPEAPRSRDAKHTACARRLGLQRRRGTCAAAHVRRRGAAAYGDASECAERAKSPETASAGMSRLDASTFFTQLFAYVTMAPLPQRAPRGDQLPSQTAFSGQLWRDHPRRLRMPRHLPRDMAAPTSPPTRPSTRDDTR